ncbi:MAG: hypothetical protein JW841_09460 [Deltaproteobacteria bacterium]|nr:hypothetical protein [Deltaproteobacteria bacterium]
MIDEQVRVQYAALYLLWLIKTPEINATALIAQGEELLEPVLKWLVEKEYVKIADNNILHSTAEGADIVAQFEQRYHHFLRDYDVFCAVDLEAGEFAVSFYDSFDDRDSWEELLAQERWDDLRLAVAEDEGIDGLEIVFMSFIQDGRYGLNSKEHWDYDRLLGSVWDEIAEVCSNAITVSDLGYEDESGEYISGEVVIADIIQQGRAILRQVQNK